MPQCLAYNASSQFKSCLKIRNFYSKVPFFPQLMDIVYWETSDPPSIYSAFMTCRLHVNTLVSGNRCIADTCRYLGIFQHTPGTYITPSTNLPFGRVWGSAIYRCSRSILSGSLRAGSICSHLAKDTSFCLLHQHEPKRMPGLLQWRKARISKELEPEMGNTLPKTNSSHLKMDGWYTGFLLGWSIFRGELLVSGRVCCHYLLMVQKSWPGIY